MTENRFLGRCYQIEKEKGSPALRRYLKKHWKQISGDPFPMKIPLDLIKAYISYHFRRTTNKNLKGLRLFLKTKKVKEELFTKKFYTLFKEELCK